MSNIHSSGVSFLSGLFLKCTICGQDNVTLSSCSRFSVPHSGWTVNIRTGKNGSKQNL